MLVAAVALLVHASAFWNAPACSGCASYSQQPGVSPHMSAVAGTIRDAAGGVVGGATVIVRSGGREQQSVSGPDGRFALNIEAGADLLVVVRAPGFGEVRQNVRGGTSSVSVDFVLSPERVTEAVTVTATRGERRTGDVPASVSVLGREDIRQSPAVVADDVLRQIPTFSLFRRTSSLASHPTAQGVSLRGVGPSGVSRTLVMLDGVPINDPFGGWVYWSRIPLETAERIEVVDGSSSSLYGNYAMGGVINVITNAPTRRTFEMKSQYGSRNSPKVDFYGSDRRGKLGLAVDGNIFDTDGYPIVRANERGRVDNNAAVKFWNVNLKADYAATERVNAFVRLGYFDENRANGKASTIDGTEEANDTTWKSASGGVRIRMPDESDLQATVFTDVETFHSNFLAVPAATPARSIGRMTLTQSVPTKGVGGMVQWSRAFTSTQFFTAGTDWRWVDGDSRENGLDAATGTQVVLNRISGGTQRSVGLYVQDLIVPLPQLTITLSARVDRWRNYNGHNLENSAITGAPTANNVPALPDRQDTVASPRAAALYHVTDKIDVWGDMGWGFRAPTLNELYRQFRVGSTLTLANPALGPEHLVGGEAGVTLSPVPSLTLRSTWFDNRVTDPVSNVTDPSRSTPTAITQQRQNLGKTRIWGIQNDVEYRIGTSWKLGAAYVYDQARVTKNPANTALVGRFLPQVPAHRGSVRLAYANPKLATIAASVQFLGAQFDEDLNVPSRRLPKYALADLTASRPIGRNVELFLAVQNLFDAEYFVGTLPTTVGAPRFVSGGFRLRLNGR
jgi:outer membrane receptor protein involved in Fe transport